MLHKREPLDGEEDTFEPTEEEQEEGPEALASLESDTAVDNDLAWSPLYSSSNENVKNQVRILQCMAGAKPGCLQRQRQR